MQGQYPQPPAIAISSPQRHDWLQHVAANPLLNNLDVRVAVVLIGFRNHETGHAFPGLKTVCDRVHAGEDSVRRSIRALRAAGYVGVEEGTGRGRGNPTHYVFLMPARAAVDPESTPAGTAFEVTKGGPNRGVIGVENPALRTPKSGPRRGPNPLEGTPTNNNNDHARETDLFADQQLPVVVASAPTSPSHQAVEAYNAFAATLDWRVVKLPLSEERQRKLGKLFGRIGIDGWQALIRHAATLRWFDCRLARPAPYENWRVDFDFVIQKADGIREGKYDGLDPFAPKGRRTNGKESYADRFLARQGRGALQ